MLLHRYSADGLALCEPPGCAAVEADFKIISEACEPQSCVGRGCSRKGHSVRRRRINKSAVAVDHGERKGRGNRHVVPMKRVGGARLAGGAVLFGVVRMVGKLHDALGPVERPAGYVGVNPIETVCRHTELQVRCTELGFESIPARCIGGEKVLVGNPPGSGYVRGNEVAIHLGLEHGSSVERGHPYVYGASRRAIEVNLHPRENRKLRLVVVRSDPEVDPVPFCRARCRHIPGDSSRPLPEVEHLIWSEINSAVSLRLDGGHQMIPTGEHGVLVSRDRMRCGRSRAVRTVLGRHRIQHVSLVSRVHGHVPIGRREWGWSRWRARKWFCK